MEPIIKFHRLMPGAVLPMRADKSALGGIPAAAYQFCEALRSASAFGWYLFPPRNIELRWDGAQVFVRVGEEWRVLSSMVDAETAAVWKEIAPPGLAVPPFLSPLFVPGIVQVWTGLVVQTAPGWGALVRPLANVPAAKSFQCFEGIIETDWFSPVPVFINLRLTATDHVIVLPKVQPLFQIQPIPRTAYTTALEAAAIEPVAGAGPATLSEAEWQGLGSTLRSISPDRPPDIGRYGAEVRKRHRDAS